MVFFASSMNDSWSNESGSTDSIVSSSFLSFSSSALKMSLNFKGLHLFSIKKCCSASISKVGYGFSFPSIVSNVLISKFVFVDELSVSGYLICRPSNAVHRILAILWLYLGTGILHALCLKYFESSFYICIFVFSEIRHIVCGDIKCRVVNKHEAFSYFTALIITPPCSNSFAVSDCKCSGSIHLKTPTECRNLSWLSRMPFLLLSMQYT